MYRIGELAKYMNLSKRTIDYYTQIGLLNPDRANSNYRLYSEDCIQILKLIEHYKNLNMPLEEIKGAIEMMRDDYHIDKEKVEKHVEQIAAIMEHLKEEIKLIEPFLEKLNSSEKEQVVSKLSPQGTTLAKSLLLLLK